MKEKTKRTLTMWGMFACLAVLLAILAIILAGPQKVSERVKMIQENVYNPLKTAIAKTQASQRIIEKKKEAKKKAEKKKAEVPEKLKEKEEPEATEEQITEEPEVKRYEEFYEEPYEEYYEPRPREVIHCYLPGITGLIYYPYWSWDYYWYWYGGFYSYWSYIGFYIGWNPWWYWTWYPRWYYASYYPYYYSYYGLRYGYDPPSGSRRVLTSIRKDQLQKGSLRRVATRSAIANQIQGSTKITTTNKELSRLSKNNSAASSTNRARIGKVPGKYQSPWGNLRPVKRYPSRTSAGTGINTRYTLPRSERPKRILSSPAYRSTSKSTVYRKPYSSSSKKYYSKSRSPYRYGSGLRTTRKVYSSTRGRIMYRPSYRISSRSIPRISSRSFHPSSPTKIRKK